MLLDTGELAILDQYGERARQRRLAARTEAASRARSFVADHPVATMSGAALSAAATVAVARSPINARFIVRPLRMALMGAVRTFLFAPAP